jgi:hypothetical protein
MAAYKRGTMSKPAGLSVTDRENISNTNLKKGFEEINKSYLDKGYTPTSFSPLGISEGMLPTYTKTTTFPGGSFTTGGQVGQSFNKMIGGGVAGGGKFPATGGLEAASMRLADAASRRNIAEKEAELEMSAKMSGYRSFAEMQQDARRKRLEQEMRGMSEERKRKQEEFKLERELSDRKKLAEGKIKVGGRWMTPVRG